MKKFYFTLYLLLIVCTDIHSQVTIGSDQQPLSGALLQLQEKKSDDNNYANADKGLLLPRVKLVGLDVFEMSGAQYANKEEHMGLMVYSAEYFCESEVKIVAPGVMIWDGVSWNILQDNEPTKSEVMTFYDQEGTPFAARKFGNAGIWMLENLGVKSFADGTPLSATPNTQASLTAPAWCYPAPNPAPFPLPSGATGRTDGSDPYYYNSHKEYGLLYNRYAALNGANKAFNIDQGVKNKTNIPGDNEVEVLFETTIGAKDGKIQGLCPNGWHIPSAREWNELEEEIYNNAFKYSYYSEDQTNQFTPLLWNTDWNIFPTSNSYDYYRGGTNTKYNHAFAMISSCSFHELYRAERGKSYLPDIGGFNAIVTGYAYEGGVRGYGEFVYYYSSSTFIGTGNPKAYSRGFSLSNSTKHQVTAGLNRTLDLNPVRCKKD